MSDKYPLFPRLSEAGEEEAQAIMDSFKIKMEAIAKEVLSTLYCDVAMYIQSSSWTNFRNELLDGFKNYNNRKIQGEYNFKEIRQAILKEHRADIIADLNQDLLAENVQLKKKIQDLYDMRNRP